MSTKTIPKDLVSPPFPGQSASKDLEAVFEPEKPIKEAGVESSGADTKTSPREVHGVRWVLVVVSVLSSIFLYALDNTVVADITPTAVNAFGDAFKLPWLSVGFLLGGSAAVLPFGKLYGLFDTKWLYIISCVIFNVGSVICGAAPSMDALIFGRVLAGVGGNGMYLGVMTILSVNTSNRERPGYLSFVGLLWGIGTVLGPVVGGAFVESPATWRWAFYINLCVAGLFAPVYIFLIPSFKPRAGTKTAALLREFDIVGSIVSVGAIVSVIMSINLGGALYSWGSGQIIGLFVTSAVLFIIFGFQQSFSIFTKAAGRIFPAHFLRNWNAVLLFICAAAINPGNFIPIYYIPLYFQFTRGDSAIEAAIRLLPLICVLSATILASGHLMGRFGYFQPWYIVGSALTLVGSVLLSRISTDTPQAEIYGFEILVGIGTGCCVQAGYAVIQALVPTADLAYGISYMMLSQLSGIAFGLAVAGAVFVNGAMTSLSSNLPEASQEELQMMLSGTSGAYYSSLSHGDRALAVDAIVQALQKVFIPAYAGAALSLVLSCLFTKRKLFENTVAIAA